LFLFIVEAEAGLLAREPNPHLVIENTSGQRFALRTILIFLGEEAALLLHSELFFQLIFVVTTRLNLISKLRVLISNFNLLDKASLLFLKPLDSVLDEHLLHLLLLQD